MKWRHVSVRSAWFGIGCSIVGCREHPDSRANTGVAGLANSFDVSAAVTLATVAAATAPSSSAVAPTRGQAVQHVLSNADSAPTDERSIHFAWRPPLAGAREYAMPAPEDQHRIVLSQGIERGGSYPVVVAMHGQPRRGQAPRQYAFLRDVANVSLELVGDGSVSPHVLVTPVFRFEGRNWPHFALQPFMGRVESILAERGITVEAIYLFGHSGAAGCGGEGLNGAVSVSPKAVGFFDTCVGAGFVNAVIALQRRGVPTLILHSVETAGFHPRPAMEYDAHFDFGKVYSRIGLRPSDCPSRLPEVPLRSLAFRCAKNDASTTRALVVDTGVGEQAHDEVVKVGMRYFLREYLPRVDVGVIRDQSMKAGTIRDGTRRKHSR